MTSKYPLFIPPDDLATKQRNEWTPAESEQYKSWLLSQIGPRTMHLRDYSGVTDLQSNEDYLLAMGTWAARTLLEHEFSSSSGEDAKLTDAGNALAADLGLLVAEILTDRLPQIEWETVRQPKNDMSFNLPVLVGFNNGMYLDPVGGSIAEAIAILRGDRDSLVWLQIVEHWGGLVDTA